MYEYQEIPSEGTVKIPRQKFLEICYQKWQKIADPEESLRCFLLLQNTILRVQNDAKDETRMDLSAENSRDDFSQFKTEYVDIEELFKQTNLFPCSGPENTEKSPKKRSFDEMKESDLRDVWNQLTSASEFSASWQEWDILEELLSPKKKKEDSINNNDVASTSRVGVGMNNVQNNIEEDFAKFSREFFI